MEVLIKVETSLISTVNVLNPLKILSLPKILVKMAVYGLYSKLEQGTNIPACAIIREIPTDLFILLLPTPFVPKINNFGGICP